MLIREPAPGTRLVVVPERKFKTVLVRVQLRSDLDDGITARNVISALLARGTRKHPDLSSLNRRLDALYGAILSTDTVKVGDWHVNSFGLSVVDERYLEGKPGLLREGFSLLTEVLFDPATEDGSFLPSYVDSEKENLRRVLDTLLNDKAQYASLRHVELMFPDEPYGKNVSGRKDDLEGLGRGELWEFYRRWIVDAPVDILVGGNVEEKRVRELLSPLMEKRRGEGKVTPFAPLRPAGEVKEVVEEFDVAQGKLRMGFRHGAVVGDERLAACEVACGILGGFPHSKLFLRVREKESLAYSVSSTYDETKGVLFVAAGIDPSTYERVKELVLEAVGETARGEFTREDLESTKAGLTRRLVTVRDGLSAMLDNTYIWSLFGHRFDPDRLVESIGAVTRDMVAQAASEFKLDTVYFLKGLKGREAEGNGRSRGTEGE